jgi:hypothetical protein
LVKLFLVHPLDVALVLLIDPLLDVVLLLLPPRGAAAK